LNKNIYLLSGILLSLFALPGMAACWNAVEISNIEGFSELDGEMVLSFKDAVSCKTVRHAEVSIGGTAYKTDDRGYLRLPVDNFADISNAKIPIKISKSGYITLETKLDVQIGTIWNRRFLMSKEMPVNQVRIVLSWNKQPRDLDLHVMNSDFHVSFRNMKSYENSAVLDRDDMDGFGPETITLKNINSHKNYQIWVENFSESPGFSGRETVYVYTNNRLKKQITLPKTDKKMVRVLNIENNNIRVTSRMK
jgi:hypothetical protein